MEEAEVGCGLVGEAVEVGRQRVVVGEGLEWSDSCMLES